MYNCIYKSIFAIYFLNQLRAGSEAFIHSIFSTYFYVPETFLVIEDRTMKKKRMKFLSVIELTLSCGYRDMPG